MGFIREVSFLFLCSILYVFLFLFSFLSDPLGVHHVGRVVHPVSGEDGILVIETAAGLRAHHVNT